MITIFDRAIINISNLGQISFFFFPNIFFLKIKICLKFKWFYIFFFLVRKFWKKREKNPRPWVVIRKRKGMLFWNSQFLAYANVRQLFFFFSFFKRFYLVLNNVRVEYLFLRKPLRAKIREKKKNLNLKFVYLNLEFISILCFAKKAGVFKKTR